MRTSEQQALYEQGLKCCPKCGCIKPVADFVKHKNEPEGIGAYCIPCHREYRKQYRLLHLDAQRKLERDRRLKDLYGLTPEQKHERIVAQNGKCMICGDIPEKGLHVDHDHVTGKLRDLLCGKCNKGLGLFQDDPALMRAAAEYVEKHL